MTVPVKKLGLSMTFGLFVILLGHVTLELILVQYAAKDRTEDELPVSSRSITNNEDQKCRL